MNRGMFGFAGEGGETYTLFLGASSETSADGTLYYTGTSFWGPSQLQAPASQKCVVLYNSIVKVASWANRTNNFFSGEDTEFNLLRYDKFGTFQNSVPLYNGPINGITGFQTMTWINTNVGMVCNQGDSLLFTWRGTWATNPTVMGHMMALSLIRT